MKKKIRKKSMDQGKYKPHTFTLNANISVVPILNNDKIWKIKDQELFSTWFLDEVEKIKQVAIEFYKNGLKLQSNYSLTYSERFFNQLISNLVQEIDLVTSIIKVNGYQGRIGFEYAKGLLLWSRYKYGRIPQSRLKHIRPITGAIYNGYWIEFGITTYNEMSELVFGEVNKEFGVYSEEDGLKRALKEAKEFYTEHGRLPTQKDQVYNKWQGSIRRGHWKEFGVEDWNSFLMLCFGDVNVKSNFYVEDIGLKRARSEFLEYEKIKGKRPISSTQEVWGIVGAIYRGEWEDKGITGFQDMIDYVFGKFDPNAVYEIAKLKANKYYKKNNRPPRRYLDQEFREFALLIERGKLRPIGINNWTEFLEHALAINFKQYKKELFAKNRLKKKRDSTWKKHGFYKGKKGFNNAVYVIKEKFDEIGKFPLASTKGLSGIYRAIQRGEFREFRSENWHEMKSYCVKLWIN